MSAGVNDQRLRRQQRFDLLEQEKSILAGAIESRSRRFRHETRALDFRRERGDSGLARRNLGPGERSARRSRPQAPHRDPREHEFVCGLRRRREAGRVELAERPLGLIQKPDQDKAPDLEIARVCGVYLIAMRFEHGARRVEPLRSLAQVP